MAKQLGDYSAGALIQFTDNSVSETGALVPWVGSAAVAVRLMASSSTTTTGVSVVANVGGVDGVHDFTINTLADPVFFSFGRAFALIGTGGTIRGVSAANHVIAEFTIGQSGIEVDSGIPQAVTSLQMTIRAAANFGDNVLTDRTALIFGSDQGYEVRADISGNTGDVVTFRRGLAVVPSGTRRYRILESTGVAPPLRQMSKF
jgi:hypothetical protein